MQHRFSRIYRKYCHMHVPSTATSRRIDSELQILQQLRTCSRFDVPQNGVSNSDRRK